jgi:hypothetical protein
LEIFGVTQLLYEFTGRADVPFGIAFQLFPKFCSPVG